MSSMIKIILLLPLFNWCEAFEFRAKLKFDVSNEMKKKENVDCPQFFQGITWPKTNDLQGRGAVRLCHTQLDTGKPGKVVFATLFSTVDRIPIYTANGVILYRNGTVYPRPNSTYWQRVATVLCNITSIHPNPVYSEMDFVSPQYLPTCIHYQAIDDDYKGNTRSLDRGHLSPSFINAQDIEKQYGSFALTNAAPQYNKFNCNSWREFECVTRQTILDYVPGEVVFIITGTMGSSGWLNDGSHHKSLVKIPKYYFKLFCFPGNPHTGQYPWAYAIVQDNVNVAKTADYRDYLTMDDFMRKWGYFHDAPFGQECMTATLGPLTNIFPIWSSYLKTHCKPPTGNGVEC